MISKETCEKIAKNAEATIIFQKSGGKLMVFVNGSCGDVIEGTALIFAQTLNAPEGKQ